MKTLFADTFFFLAVLNEKDQAHEEAFSIYADPQCQFLSTPWVLTEVGDALCFHQTRRSFLELLDFIHESSHFHIIPCEEMWFERGLKLYSGRPDKDWSLTDCISFVVMKEHRLKEALTGDRHFEQAGFKVLLK